MLTASVEGLSHQKVVPLPSENYRWGKTDRGFLTVSAAVKTLLAIRGNELMRLLIRHPLNITGMVELLLISNF